MSTKAKIYNINECGKGNEKSNGMSKKILEGQDMDDLLKTYIEKVDKDQMALREEMRERERRTEKRIDDSEKRMEAKVDRIEKMMNVQNEKFDKLKESIDSSIEEDRKFHYANMIAVISGVVATILTVISLNHSAISTITSIMGLAK